MLKNKNILMVISGGVAAFKALEIIRMLKKQGANVQTILTAGGAQFVTPLSVASLSENPVYTELFSLKDETEMGHIKLSREADLILVVPATANLIERLARGEASDLASTTLLASDKPIMVCPAMNVEMWEKPATKRNIKTLSDDGVLVIGPEVGVMACGEEGVGRLSEPGDIMEAVFSFFNQTAKPLKDKKIIITAGPTHEPIDPVRYIANRSSGRQGYALAEALSALGGDVHLVSGPTALQKPKNVCLYRIETAEEMLNACQKLLPAHAFIAVAAVADWRVANSAPEKLKKDPKNTGPMTLNLEQNPDILKTIATDKKHRPQLVIGFAAETENVIVNAQKKLMSKNCDWVIANNVSTSENVMGGGDNTISIVTHKGIDPWPKANKTAIAQKLARLISEELNKK